MFKTSKNKQGDMFRDISQQLSNRKKKLMEARESWHNVMWREVVSQIDERPYAVLYDKEKGRPNASIRVLIGMMILKEGNGWSDEQLFEECRFNIKVMRSLGLNQMDDDVPVESTYYEFRGLLGDHLEKTGEDLLKQTFGQITASQVLKYGVSGKKIRMDSKLINSNIAISNRIELILEALRHYVKHLNLAIYRKDFKKDDYAFLEVLQNKTVTNITYSLSGNKKQVLLERLGPIIGKLLSISMSQSESYRLLKQVFEDQYEEREENKEQGDDPTDTGGDGVKKQVPRAPKDIGSDTIQSVHDPGAKFRTKGHGPGKQNIWGYHANIAESCGKEDELNLIVDADVVEANVSEDAFLIPAIENSQKVLGQEKGTGPIEEVIVDGGYDSKSNRKAMLDDEQPRLSIAKMKGSKHRYEMDYDEDQQLQVREKEDGTVCSVSYSAKVNKYVIKSPKGGSIRYMTQEEVDNYMVHQQISEQVDEESYHLRASAESTIHQVFHRLKKRNKMVYRGRIKCQWYVLSRAFWVNLTRISQKELENALILTILVLRTLMKAQIMKNKNLIPKLEPIEIL
jgi:hypothetical protein